MNTNPSSNINHRITDSSSQDVKGTNRSPLRKAWSLSGAEPTASNREGMTMQEQQDSSPPSEKLLQQRSMDSIMTTALNGISNPEERGLVSNKIEQILQNPLRYIGCNVSNQNISDEGVAVLVSILGKKSSLRHWYFSENHIGEIGVKKLVELFSNTKNLTRLNLNGNPIHDDGATELANALLDNITLQELYLEKTQIGDKGLAAFLNALKKNYTLLKLSVSSDTIRADEGSFSTNVVEINQLLDRNRNIHRLLNQLKSCPMNLPETDYLAKVEKLFSTPNSQEVIKFLLASLIKLTSEIDRLRNNNCVPKQIQTRELKSLFKKRKNIVDYSKEIIQALDTLFITPSEKASPMNKYRKESWEKIKYCNNELKNELITAFEGNLGFVMIQYGKGYFDTPSLPSAGKLQCVHEIRKGWEGVLGSECPTWLATSEKLTTLNNFLSVLKGNKEIPCLMPNAQELFTSLSNLIEQLTTEQSTDTSSPGKKEI